MSLRRGSMTTAWALAALLGAGAAPGDSVCEKGYRDTTAAERETMTAVLETARAALPPAPPGWVIQGDERISVPESRCQDYDGEPYAYQFARYYQRVDDQQARTDLLAAAGTGYKADMAAKQPRLDALMARMTELSLQVAEAAQKGDFARVETINLEIEKVSAEYQSVWEEDGTLARIEAATEEAGRDLEMSVTVAINPTHATARDGAGAMRLPAGALAAFRWTQERGSVREGGALVLFGAWRPSAHGGFEFVPRAGAAPQRAQTVWVSLQADESRMDALAAGIDFAALAGVLGR